jgi:SAM-dependent methyltransferase
MAVALSAYMAAHRDEVAVTRYRHNVAGLPAWLRVAPPAKFGEIGWLIDGAIVNHDTVAYAERLALLYTSGLLDQLIQKPDCRVLEIGGGYGALAYYLKQAIPQMTYYIVDIPESLVFSSIYLSALFESGIHFVPNYEFPQLANSAGQFDLVINTLSMSEMTEQQVVEYCSGIQKIIGDSGKFFEQNQDNRPVGFINAQNIIEQFFMTRTSLGGPLLTPHLEQGFANIWEQPRPMPNR